MRLVIKNADFSGVSIGKVVKDLSFEYDAHNLSWLQQATPPSYSDIDAAGADGIAAGSSYGVSSYWKGSNGDADWVKVESGSARFTSIPIEVSEGMVITLKRMANTSDACPVIECLNSEGEPLSTPSGTVAAWNTDDMTDVTFTIPANTKYIMVIFAKVYKWSSVKGVMPE